MKRSSNVQRPSMEKAIGKAFPFVMFGTFMVFSQYESKTEGAIYLDSNECKNNNLEQAEECELAYQEALAEAERTGPKYKTERECEYDFREDDCYYSSRYFSYIPRMGGYYYSTDLDDFDGYKKRYYSQPMYRYKKGYYSGSGQFFGSHRITPVTLASTSLKKGGGTIGSAMSRGGFGKAVSSSRGG
ncbi:DUF1190 domain-containing protein [Vibrio sp. 16]|uniref:DUF1190 domain-containing protein n=1 Tax=Vibrio sp. 16 TaxID=391586 RepID=UPI0002F5DE8C|nr:DUF1190 domain-containing protein [Vibrio sp. 16]CAK4067364.1 hypothetical protein VDT1_0502 [Vibrio sp. 16]